MVEQNLGIRERRRRRRRRNREMKKEREIYKKQGEEN